MGVRVADFGMALFSNGSRSTYASGANRWMAPELFSMDIDVEDDDPKHRPTCASDIYSLGHVISEVSPVVFLIQLTNTITHDFPVAVYLEGPILRSQRLPGHLEDPQGCTADSIRVRRRHSHAGRAVGSYVQVLGSRALPASVCSRGQPYSLGDCERVGWVLCYVRSEFVLRRRL